MTNTRYEELTHIFEAYRRKIQRDLQAKLREARARKGGDADSSSPDTADISAADLEQHVGAALMEMSAETLRRIDDAVVRLSSGAYGWCADCDGEISQKRLAALPLALRCRECEAAHEVSIRGSRLHALERVGSTWSDAPCRD